MAAPTPRRASLAPRRRRGQRLSWAARQLSPAPESTLRSTLVPATTPRAGECVPHALHGALWRGGGRFWGVVPDAPAADFQRDGALSRARVWGHVGRRG